MFPASIHVYLHVCVCFCVHEMSCNNKIKGRREELRRFSLYKFHACTFLLCCLDMDVNVLCLTMDVKFGKIVPNVRETPTKCTRGYTNRKKTLFFMFPHAHTIFLIRMWEVRVPPQPSVPQQTPTKCSQHQCWHCLFGAEVRAFVLLARPPRMLSYIGQELEVSRSLRSSGTILITPSWS